MNLGRKQKEREAMDEVDFDVVLLFKILEKKIFKKKFLILWSYSVSFWFNVFLMM